MAWFAQQKTGTVDLEGSVALRVTKGDGTSLLIDVSALRWIGFLFVGDAFSPVYEGWWLFGQAQGVTAVGTDRPRVDYLLRHEPLLSVADALADKVRIDVASRPRALRGREAREGIVHLDEAAASSLRARGVAQAVASVRAFPNIM